MRYAAALVVAAWLITFFVSTVPAQSPDVLPAGIINVQVDDQGIAGSATPVIANPAPEVSGRVELGSPTIILTLVGASSVQFPTDVDQRGRFRATVPEVLADGLYTLSINDLVTGTFEIRASAAPAQQAAIPLLDIARVVPYPADFGNAIPGIGFLDGRFYTIEEEAARTATANGDTSGAVLRDLERRLSEAGWLQRYESRLAAPTRGNQGTFRVQFSSFVVEYATNEQAQAAYSMLVSDSEAISAPLVGEESTTMLFSGVTPDTGVEYQAARVVFRIGPMLAVIVYADLTNESPDLALLDVVAQNVAGRAAVVLARDTVPLGSMILRLDAADATQITTRRDLYDVRAGILTSLFGEDDATRANRVAIYTGTTDAFVSTTNGSFAAPARVRRSIDESQESGPIPTSVILIEGDSGAESATTPTAGNIVTVEEPSEEPAAQVAMTSALYAFPGPAEADVWLTSQERTVATNSDGTATYEPVVDGANFGDASATFAVSQTLPGSDQTANGFRIYTRVGEIVSVLELVSSPGVQLNGVNRLARMQVDCIIEGGCAQLGPLPASIFGGEDAPVSDSPRGARRREQPAPTPVPEPAPPPAPIDQPPPVVEEVIPVEEVPLPVEEVPVPVEEVPTPIEEPAPPVEAPIEEPAPPVEEVPPPAEELPPPVEEASPPAEEAPPAEVAPPAEEVSPAEESTPPPVEEVTPAEENPPVAEPTPAPVIEPTPAPVVEPTAIPIVEEPIVFPTPAPDTSAIDDGGNRDDDRGRRNRRDRDRRRGRD